MMRRLLLFEDEYRKLRETGWDYEVVASYPEEGIWVVDAEVPPEIDKEVDLKCLQ